MEFNTSFCEVEGIISSLVNFEDYVLGQVTDSICKYLHNVIHKMIKDDRALLLSSFCFLIFYVCFAMYGFF